MEENKREEFFKNDGIPTRGKALMHTMYSDDTDKIFNSLIEADLSRFDFAKSIYDGYERAKSITGSSLSYYCWILSFKIKQKTPRYFKNWYLIFRHFCVRSCIDPSDLVGIDYKFMKFIAESGQELMTKDITKEAVERLKEPHQDYSKKWKYIKELKEMRRDYINTNNPTEFVYKWHGSGLI